MWAAVPSSYAVSECRICLILFPSSPVSGNKMNTINLYMHVITVTVIKDKLQTLDTVILGMQSADIKNPADSAIFYIKPLMKSSLDDKLRSSMI